MEHIRSLFSRYQYWLFLSIAVVAVGISYFWMVYVSKEPSAELSNALFVVEEQSDGFFIHNDAQGYSFMLDTRYVVENLGSAVSFYIPTTSLADVPFLETSYLLTIQQHPSLVTYVDLVINTLHDPLLSLELQEPLFIGEKEIIVGKIDHTKSYWPSEGGVSYFYEIPLADSKAVLLVSLQDTNALDTGFIRRLITQLLN